MKKFFLLGFLMILVLGCSDDDEILSPLNSNQYRKIAYESLSSDDKESLTNCWCLAPVRSGKYSFIKNEVSIRSIIIDDLNKWSFKLIDENYFLFPGQRLIAVVFNTDIDPLVGPIVSIVNPNTDEVIGYCLRY